MITLCMRIKPLQIAESRIVDNKMPRHLLTQMTAKIESRFADGKTVWIDIDAITNSSCKMTIRVGTLGDEARSRKILEKIHRHLGIK